MIARLGRRDPFWDDGKAARRRNLRVRIEGIVAVSLAVAMFLPIAAFAPVEDDASSQQAAAAIGFPAILKSRRFGYDGKGQAIVRDAAELAAAQEVIGGPAILERFVDFAYEASIVAVRGIDGAFAAYDPVENAHRDGILRTSTVPGRVDAATAKGGAAPAGVTPLARDIFTSDDFYVDRELWRDPRYFRCNSTLGLDSQWGDYSSGPTYITDDAAKGAWGHCEIDYAREHIVSPYGFATARAHYEALLAESRAHGGPTQYNRERLPPDWDGRYTNLVSVIFGLVRAGKEPVVPPELGEPPQWIIGYHNQVPTILSLLTPEYQQRLVQQLYHQAHDRAPQWSAMLCRPEGFMRWWSGPGGPG